MESYNKEWNDSKVQIDEEILEFVNRPKKLKVWKFHRGVLQLWILKGKFSCEGQDM